MAKTIKEIYKEFDDHMTDVGKDLGRAIIKIDKARRRKQIERTLRKEEKARAQKSRELVIPKTLKYEFIGYFIAFVAIIFIVGYPFNKPWSYLDPLGKYKNSSSDFGNQHSNEFTADSHEHLPVFSYPLTEDSTISSEKTEKNPENVGNTENMENSVITDTSETDTVEKKTEQSSIVEEANETEEISGLNEYEIGTLVQAVLHETGGNPNFYPNGDYDMVQQLMTASILNRIGKPGFGYDYTTPGNLNDVLSNSIQYGNILNELYGFDAFDERTRNNVMSVLTGETYIPNTVYFERCSEVGEDYYSAQASFYNQYRNDSSVTIYYMAPTLEGRYIIFAINPNGAY